MLRLILFILILFIPLVYYIFDFVYLVICQKRSNVVVRFFIDIISLLIYPLLFCAAMLEAEYSPVINDFKSLAVNIAVVFSAAVYLSCAIAYFASNYRGQSYAPLTQGIFNIIIVIAILINTALCILITIHIHFIIAAIGNLPLIITYVVTLIQNLHKQME